MRAKRISIMTYEGDRWQRELLQPKLLEVLKQHGVTTATAVMALAGCSKSEGVTTRSLVDGGGPLPVVVEFVASAEDIEIVLPIIKPMIGTRQITVAAIEIDIALNR